MKCLEICLKQTRPETETIESIIAKIDGKIANPLSYKMVEIGQYDLDLLKPLMESKYGCTVRTGVTGGCYGSRDGSEFNGLTLWMHPELYPDRFIDSDGDEIVNIYHLIIENGGELVEGLDGDLFEEQCEELGLRVGRDNTYNYAGNGSETPSFLFDACFAIIENEDAKGSHCAYLSIMFHCGGDPRGNYTSKVVYKFRSLDDIYSVVLPCKVLTDEEVANETL